MGFLNLGAISLLLSPELVGGFTTGAAVHVFTSQVKYVLGVTTGGRSGIFKIPMVKEVYYHIFVFITVVKF